MTIFRALPVAQGDAFLLTTSDACAYLVDGGRRRAGVPSMPMQLAASGVPLLDAAIVTHTDRDHVEGIEDLLLGRFPVSEYWLPANWLDTIVNARRFGSDWTWGAAVKEILRKREPVTPDGDEPRRRRRSAYNDRKRNDDHALTADLALGGIATSALALATTKLEENASSESFHHRRDVLLEQAADILKRSEEWDEARVAEMLWYLDGHLMFPDNMARGDAATLSRVATAAVEGIHSDAAELTRTLATIGRGSAALAMARSRYFPKHWHPRVRFFDYSDAVVDHAIAGHPTMICVNGTEVAEPIEMPYAVTLELVAMVTRVATLSRVNRQSRVFRFDDGASEVLFCGDSALAFTDKPITLGRPAIVTAPHHGALANAKAYARISGRRLTWVRSDEQNTTKRPCGNYVALPRKYCTTCGGSPACVELVFDRAAGNWKTDAAPCRCTAKAATYAIPSRYRRLSISR